MTTDEEVAFLKAWAADNKCYFEDEGEVGFGRECVGIVRSDHYPSYRVYDGNPDWNEIHDCPAAHPPESVEDSYHKADVLCVLGRGPGAIHQLYLWVKHLSDNGIVVRQILRTPDDDFDAMMHGFETSILTVDR